MKLWIDDIRNAPSDDWTVAKSVTTAIRAISKFNFDTISIDHDISHQVVVGKLSRPYPCDECFCPVVYYLAEKYYTDRELPDHPDIHIARPLAYPKIIIHTSNPVGAKEMYEILKDSGVKSEIKLTGRIANRLEMEVE